MKTLLAVLLLVPAVLGPAFAQEAAGKPSTAQQDFTKDAYVIEQLSSRITAESDGTGTREVTAQVKVLAEAGVKAFAVLSFVYTSWNEVVEFDYVRVLKPDGTVVKTPDYNIQDMPGDVTRTAPLYSDVHEKHVIVKGLGVGDTLEYLVRIRIIKPEVPGQFWYEYEFTDKSIIKDERLELNVPADKYVKVVSPNYKPELKTEGGRRIYSWTHSNLVVKEKDPDEIPRRIPPNPDVQITTFASWEDVGRWYGSLQKEPLTITPSIQKKADELTKNLKTDDEKIHAIYNFVSLKFHYIGLDFGIGRYQPHAADDVLDNGYGDCKDKHTLLASLLKAAGYDAWPVLIHAHRKLDPDVPSPAQFNHVITVVPLNGSYIWLDTTPEVAPYRLLLLALRNKQALVIPSDQPAKLMMTPADPPQQQHQEFSMSGKLGADGTFTGHAEESLEGDPALLMRMAFRQVPEAQWKEMMQRVSQAMNFGGEVSNVKVSPPGDIDNPLQISYDYLRKDYGDWENHHTMAALPPMGVELSKDVRLKKPLEPFILGSLGTITYRSKVELPDGYRVETPTVVHLVEPFAEYSSRTNFQDRVLTTTRVLEIRKTEVPIESWDDFRKFGAQMSDDEFNFMTVAGTAKAVIKLKQSGSDAITSDPIDILRPPEKLDAAGVDRAFHDGEYALQQQDFQKAKELMEQVIAANPDYKGAHLDLGLALASRGSLDNAVEQFRKEEEVSPENTRVYQVLGSYFAMTHRWDEAIDEWRKLLKIDPDNRTAVSTLAALLYHEEKYPEAAKVLEPALKTAPDSADLQNQLAGVYLKTGQGERALALYRQSVQQRSDPMTLNNIAYSLADSRAGLDSAQGWAEKAVEELEKQSRGAESSIDASLAGTYNISLTWDTLGWVYFQQGKFTQAEEYVRAAWTLGEEAIVGEHLGEIYEREGKKQEATRLYEYALAVTGAPPANSPLLNVQTDAIMARRKQASEIISRYQALTGKLPVTSIRRLPNGEWTKTPAEQLLESREVKIVYPVKVSASARFALFFKDGEVERVQFEAGESSLNELTAKLKVSHYPIEFPPDSDAVVVMHLDVTCHRGEPCVGTLVNPLPPRAITNSLASN